jgi:Kef-type K+ transport system membrane component KefB
MHTHTTELPASGPSLKKGVLFYLAMVALFSFGLYQLMRSGQKLENHSWTQITQASETKTQPLGFSPVTPVSPAMMDEVLHQFLSNLTHPLSIALLQIIIIISISRIFSYLMRLLGQPTVIGEIIAGIFLGPSVFGSAMPLIWSSVFPIASLPNLHSISTIGLSLFMFIIGLELDISLLNKRIQTALFVSHASILVPFLMGVFLAYGLYSDFAPGGISFVTFGLFMGVSMSITAFPVLARIIQERGLSRTPLGVMAITCAATDDISAWCILAVVIAIAKAGNVGSAIFTLLLAVGYVLIMFKVIKPFMKNLSEKFVFRGQITRPYVAMSILILLVSAYVAEVIGIHALFGAFLAGVTIPHDPKIKEALRQKIEDVSLLLFLPVFFAFTGLRTQIGLLVSDGLWSVCLLVLLVAVAGKVFGTVVASKLMNQTWKNSFSLGVLMNTRGLMELVVLNIGYDLGIISPEMFVVLVLMAIATTLMTGPLLNLLDIIWPEKHNPETVPILNQEAEPD